MRTFLAALSAFALTALAALGVVLTVIFWPELQSKLPILAASVDEQAAAQPGRYVRAPLDRISDLKLPSFEPTRVIYLNREGARLYPGRDDASKNRSALVRLAERPFADIPAFEGTAATWKTFVACVQDKFKAFNVQVKDQRPMDGAYLMAVVGGTHTDLEGDHPPTKGAVHSHSTGLAPFTGSPINDAVVLVFSRTLRESSLTLCETASMELAHAYGLDHAFDCHDLMTYRPRCGVRTFIDKPVPCGEHTARACAGGEATQNSHQTLLKVLGAHP